VVLCSRVHIYNYCLWRRSLITKPRTIPDPVVVDVPIAVIKRNLSIEGAEPAALYHFSCVVYSWSNLDSQSARQWQQPLS